jgi:hypothetical protein
MLKTQEITPTEILLNKVDLIEEIYRESRLRIALFLRRMDYSFESLLNFLRNPGGLPKRSAILIAKKFLNDVIGQHYYQIKKENLTVKLVYKSILERMFRGSKQIV